ncbi:MAG TPA: dephospho-CoA kinase [Cytophagales bacterium]|nr:dephospho-CoA kinase [Cytophagales bacterium]
MGKKLLQIGVTGGIGSGKSTICKIFYELGAPIYDADSRAKWILANDEVLRKQIIEKFGAQSYNEKKEINRDYLAAQVFNDSEKVKILNSLVHPRVGQDYSYWAENTPSKTGYIVKEAALLFESGSYKALDKIVTVEAPEELRISRILKRDPFRKSEEIRGIIAKQMTDEQRRALSDYIIYNDEKNLVIPQVLKLHEEFLSLSRKNKS